MTTLRQAAQQALDAWDNPMGMKDLCVAMDALRTALKQQQAEPVCWCRKCNENRLVNNIPFSMTRMILCPTCGNKRCPKASDHRLGCTDSNAAGQPGSAYPAPPQQQAEPVGTLKTAIASEPTALIHKWRVLELIKYYAPQRKPLTDAEFCEQWLKQTGRIMGTDKQLLLQAKQVTEAAHGIKEGT